MGTLIAGFVLLVAVVGASFGPGTTSHYLQWHSLVLVCIGSCAVLIFSNPWGVLRSLVRALRDLGGQPIELSFYQQEIARLAGNREAGKLSRHGLIKYASELWEQGTEPDLFVALLSQRKRELVHRDLDAVQALKNLSKYPPALGMIGTVMGMVALFQGLDQNKSNIGANLSLAMTATFYGLIMTNVVIGPLADRLHVKHVRASQMHDAIYELLLLINRGESSTFIAEEVRDRAA